MDIKEVVGLLYTAIDLAADGGPEAFTDEEYSEMHELLKKIKSGQLGWHPASELPPVDDNGNSDRVVGIREFPSNIGQNPCYVRVVEGKWNKNNLKWWCYPPKND